MNDRLFNAYDQYVVERVRAGIIDHSLDAAILDGKTVEEHVVEVLRAAGRLPRGWGLEAVAAELIAPANDRGQFARVISSQRARPRDVADPPEFTGGWLRAS